MKTPSRLRWRGRRGMRELDILFSRFLDERFAQLDDADAGIFERMLEESDADLLAWLTGQRSPVPPEYDSLIRQLRALAPAPGP